MSELLLSYYGDDLTGSTDALEALASHGVPSVLFTRRPSDEQRARFAHFDLFAEPARRAESKAKEFELVRADRGAVSIELLAGEFALFGPSG